MKRSSKNLRAVDVVSDAELQEELQQAFEEPLLPDEWPLAAVLKVIRPPASGEAIARLRAEWDVALPASYLEFLRQSDGAAGCLSDEEGDYLTLWGSAEVVERNASLSRHSAWPEFVAIGTDGQGGWVGFCRAGSLEPESWPVVRVNGSSSIPAGVRELARNFQEWARDGFRLRAAGFLCGGG
jgi:hypothetical protein